METFIDAQMWGFSERWGETQSKGKKERKRERERVFYRLNSGCQICTPYSATAMLCLSKHRQHCIHALWVR